MIEFYGRVGIICMFEETMEIFLRVCPFYVDIVYKWVLFAYSKKQCRYFQSWSILS